MIYYNNGAIKMSRGDDVLFNLTVRDNTGSEYTFSASDVVIFRLIQNNSTSNICKPNVSPVLTKNFILDSDYKSAQLNLNYADTHYLCGNIYNYTIILKHINQQTPAENYSETILFGSFELVL